MGAKRFGIALRCFFNRSLDCARNDGDEIAAAGTRVYLYICQNSKGVILSRVEINKEAFLKDDEYDTVPRFASLT